MHNFEVAIIIPTIRSLDFLTSWQNQFRDTIGIIVEDHQNQEIKIPHASFRKVYHYTWKNIDRDLGKNSWIISRKNAGIRSYGFLKAYQMGIRNIITLDDDCYPVKNHPFVRMHLDNLALRAPIQWFPTYPHRKYNFTRGIPYAIRNKKEVVISHGLWSNVLDFDAPTQLLNFNLTIPSSFDFIEFIPEKYYFPMCSMNLAFKSKVTPLMYFPLMGSDPAGHHWGYDRFDDIWAGIFAKKVIDHLGLAVVNGSPFVKHQKASNVFTNLKKEAKGIETNEEIFLRTGKVKLTAKTIKASYQELVEKIRFPKEEYFTALKKALIIWLSLF